MVVAGCRQEEQDWGHHQVRVLGIQGLLNDWETAQQTTAGALHRTAIAGTAELSGAGGAWRCARGPGRARTAYAQLCAGFSREGGT